MANNHFDRSNSRQALLFAAVASLLVLCLSVCADFIGTWLFHTKPPSKISIAGILIVFPFTLFPSAKFHTLILMVIGATIVNGVINSFLGFSLAGAFAQWLLFTLGFYRMERADYAAQTQPTDPTKLPPGQI